MSSSLHVLAIEPSAAQQKILRKHLAETGLTDIRIYSSASAALDQLYHQPADLLFTDLLLPDMRGFAFIRRLANQRHKPALAITSNQPGSLLDSKCTQARLSGLEIVAQLRRPLLHSDIARVVQTVQMQLTERRQPPLPEQYYFSRDALLTAIGNGEIHASTDMYSAEKNQAPHTTSPVEWQHPQLGKLQASQFMRAIELNGLQEVLQLSILNKPGLLAAWQPMLATSSKNPRRNTLQPWQRA